MQSIIIDSTKLFDLIVFSRAYPARGASSSSSSSAPRYDLRRHLEWEQRIRNLRQGDSARGGGGGGGSARWLSLFSNQTFNC